MWQIIKLIQTFMGALVTCKTEEDPFKNEGARVVIKDLPFLVHAVFYDAQGQTHLSLYGYLKVRRRSNQK